MYSKSTTKYRVKELLNQLPATDRNIAMRNLPSYLNISRQTFSKILNVKLDDPYEPAAGKLIKLALFFNCTTEYLLEIVPDAVTIDELRILQSEKTANDLSLSK